MEQLRWANADHYPSSGTLYFSIRNFQNGLVSVQDDQSTERLAEIPHSHQQTF